MSNIDEKSLKLRVLAISDNIPGEYIKIICEAFPEYDNDPGRTRISNVKRTVIPDARITRILELVADAYQDMKNKIKEFSDLVESEEAA